MELFYSTDISGSICTLNQEESAHCVRVLRHKVGDIINVIDGCGSLYECRIAQVQKNSTELEILNCTESFGAHDYHLAMAVCPTKNIDRYEWFLEKVTEIGVDSITPAIGEHSERKVIKTERCEKILLSAAKQSLKGAVPQLEECCSVKDFICNWGKESISDAENPEAGVEPLKLIAYCGDALKLSVDEAVVWYLEKLWGSEEKRNGNALPQIAILIGPEGDFSEQEVALAMENGFIPVHLGASRLRTETAAVVACSQVYTVFSK